MMWNYSKQYLIDNDDKNEIKSSAKKAKIILENLDIDIDWVQRYRYPYRSKWEFFEYPDNINLGIFQNSIVQFRELLQKAEYPLIREYEYHLEHAIESCE